MACIYKCKTGWRAQLQVKGVRVSQVFQTKTEARIWASEKELELRGGKTITASNRTVQDLFNRYGDEVTPGKKGSRWELIRLKAWEGSELSKVYLDDLSAEHIAAWRDERLRTVAASTVNRELNLISAMMTRAVKEWRWLKSNPVSDVRRPRNPKHRDRLISDDEIRSMLEGFGYDGVVETKSQLLAVYFLFAMETAMRLGEICGLESGDFFDDYVVLWDSKNGDKRYVPLSPEAQRLAVLIRDSGMRLSSEVASSRFRTVARRQGIMDITFHDTRHTAITRLARKLDVLDLARMVGHRDLKSLMIYYNATPSELAQRLR